MEYATALDRAYDVLPETPREGGDRLQVPDPEGQTDGAFTRLTNLEAISKALSRDADHLHRSIQRDLGTSGQFDGSTARYSGSFDIADFQAAIDAYVTEFVTCSECGLPDTRLVTEDGVDMLRCEACGAFRPVAKSSKQSSSTVTEDVESGRTYQVEITGTGRKGDGVAKKNGYTIFVSGAREGQVVDAYIESVSGDLAFARVA
ncbi:translation initiation factor IF-2 subunit beta [Halorubellus sp. PRR65]|uniref:translation initiation factor IF-2 subunit beta n=1 Tax=Halorubellus sp. PRR65 TaxID=3098148 RepID=UPI002B2610D6|nr:translation initiation factor IF-2 subunit beta [Halorubellus sp. PRR65]